MWCSDRFVNYLKDLGYCMIWLPRADIRPLQIYTKRGGGLDSIGDLKTVFQAGSTVPLPDIRKNILAANVSGRGTSTINIGVGLSILGKILGAMGGSQLGLDTEYRQARSVVFEFQEVLEDRVEPAKLEQFLADASISQFSPHVTRLLEADRIYVTVATLKSKKLTVEARTGNKSSLAVNLPEMQGIVGGNVKVSGDMERSTKITFEGKIDLVFGFKAVQLFYEDGYYRAFEPLQSGTGMRDGSTEANAVRYIETEGPFLRLNDE
jgi:hypothetical protein